MALRKEHDTLSVTKRLKGSGMNDTQAEAVAKAIYGSITSATANLVTKDELIATESRLTADIARLETKLTADIGNLEIKLAADIGNLETKLTADIGNLETKLTADIGNLETRLTTTISNLETRLAWRFTTAMFAIAGLVIAFQRLVPL